VYGMGMAALVERGPHLAGSVHEDLPQAQLHQASAPTAPTSTPTAGPAWGWRWWRR
jgi:hypothetical protein